VFDELPDDVALMAEEGENWLVAVEAWKRLIDLGGKTMWDLEQSARPEDIGGDQ
jgi:hypothetical protein